MSYFKDVNVLRGVSPILSLSFQKLVNLVTLLSDINVGDKVITLTPGHGCIVGNILCFREAGRVTTVRIIDVTGDDITIDSVIDYGYTTEAIICHATDNLIVDGSVTPQVFSVKAENITGKKLHVYIIRMHLIGSAALEDEDFASITNGLTNGVLLRKANDEYSNICNIKTNGDLVDVMNVVYEDKPINSLRGTCNFLDEYGVIVELTSTTSDELQLIINDDLTGGAVTHFNANVKCHICEC